MMTTEMKWDLRRAKLAAQAGNRQLVLALQRWWALEAGSWDGQDDEFCATCWDVSRQIGELA